MGSQPSSSRLSQGYCYHFVWKLTCTAARAVSEVNLTREEGRAAFPGMWGPLSIPPTDLPTCSLLPCHALCRAWLPTAQPSNAEGWLLLFHCLSTSFQEPSWKKVPQSGFHILDWGLRWLLTNGRGLGQSTL